MSTINPMTPPVTAGTSTMNTTLLPSMVLARMGRQARPEFIPSIVTTVTITVPTTISIRRAAVGCWALPLP